MENTSSEQVIKISSQVALFKSIDKLNQWVNTNLTEKVFYEEIKLKKIKKKTELCETIPLNLDVNDLIIFTSDTMMPSEIFNIIKVKKIGFINSLIIYFFLKNIQKKILTKVMTFLAIESEILNLLENIEHFINKNVKIYIIFKPKFSFNIFKIFDNKLSKSVKLYLVQVSFEIILLFSNY